MIEKNKIMKAIHLAEEFLIAAEAVLRTPSDLDKDYVWGGIRTANMKRKSMDLTRALTVIRKPGER